MKLKVGDLVISKTEPRFHLDWSYKGPFVIRFLSTTSADIQLKDDPTSEILNVSRQHVIVQPVHVTVNLLGRTLRREAKFASKIRESLQS